MAPHISFVCAAQNTAHYGDLIYRLQCSLDSILGCGLDLEYILVEWNPPADRARLESVLRWDRNDHRVRIITVPPAWHNRVPNPHGQYFFEFLAKNVGIRAARGQFIICTNADDIFNLYSAIELKSMKPGYFYRMNRFDIRDAFSTGRELFCIKRANGNFAPGEPHIGRSKTGVPYSANMLHFNAAGDFTAMAREHWLHLRGYPEVPYDGSVDGQMVYIAHKAGLKQVVLESPLYHLDHPRSRRVMYTANWSDATPYGERNASDDWGVFRER